MDHCVDHQSVFRGWSQASDPAQLCRGGHSSLLEHRCASKTVSVTVAMETGRFALRSLCMSVHIWVHERKINMRLTCVLLLQYVLIYTRPCTRVCVYKGWWFILVHLAVFVRTVSSLYSMFSGKSFFFGCQCADGRFLSHAATLSAQIISMLKYLICFFFCLIDYINDKTRCFLLLQIIIWNKLLNDEGGLPPDRGLSWQWTGVPAGIYGKTNGIFCNTDMTRITVGLFRLRCNKLLPASQKFADLHREENLAGMCSVLHPLCYSVKKKLEGCLQNSIYSDVSQQSSHFLK